MIKLTPWDAPKNPQTFDEWLEQHPQFQKPQRPTKPSPWQRFKGKFKGLSWKNWTDTPLVYLLYVLPLGLDLYSDFSSNYTHERVAGWATGFIIGILFMTFLHRLQKGLDKSMRNMEVQMAVLDAEARIREEYETKWAP